MEKKGKKGLFVLRENRKEKKRGPQKKMVGPTKIGEKIERKDSRMYITK